MKKQLFTLLFAAFATTAMAQEPLKLPALSPTASIHQDFSTSAIDISYSRPSMRGRKIFGDLLDYGEVWRTGANAATKIKIGEDLVIGGVEVKAGEYALYTIPQKGQWEVILNKGTGNWGVSGYSKEDDVARFAVKTKELRDPVQTFTINVGSITFNSCEIELSWEKTMVAIPVMAKNNERLVTSIDKAINNPSLPYTQAANYYLETNQNLDMAMHYTDKAIEQNPTAFWLYHLKAKIAAKQGNKMAAITAANKSTELAKGTAYEAEYARNNDRVVKSLKK